MLIDLWDFIVDSCIRDSWIQGSRLGRRLCPTIHPMLIMNNTCKCISYTIITEFVDMGLSKRMTTALDNRTTSHSEAPEQQQLYPLSVRPIVFAKREIP